MYQIFIAAGILIIVSSLVLALFVWLERQEQATALTTVGLSRKSQTMHAVLSCDFHRERIDAHINHICALHGVARHGSSPDRWYIEERCLCGVHTDRPFSLPSWEKEASK
jgi:hypothetical protein